MRGARWCSSILLPSRQQPHYFDIISGVQGRGEAERRGQKHLGKSGREGVRENGSPGRCYRAQCERGPKCRTRWLPEPSHWGSLGVFGMAAPKTNLA